MVCKAYPDKDKEFHNILELDEIEDKVFMMKEKWSKYEYSLENGLKKGTSDAVAVDDNEGEIFGVEV